MCWDFLAESLVMRKLQGSKLTFSKISARIKAPKNSRSPFYGKNPLKMGNYTIFQMFENPRRGRQAGNFTTNVPKILDLKSSSCYTWYMFFVSLYSNPWQLEVVRLTASIFRAYLCLNLPRSLLQICHIFNIYLIFPGTFLQTSVCNI